MKKIVFIICFALCAALGAVAQQKVERKVMTDEEKQQWLVELRNYKHDFLARELGLTKEQQTAFFPVYDQMDDDLNRVTTEVREMENSLDLDQASSEEIQQAAFAQFEQKNRESVIELTYFEKFKDVLTPQQLFKLKNAERKFTQQLVRKHHGRQRPQ